MGNHCKECGKELNWLNSSESYVKGYCAKCLRKKVQNCRVCGKKMSMSFWSVDNERFFAAHHDFMCPDCWSTGKEHSGETSCGNCAYCLTRIGLVEKINLMSAFMTGQGTYAEQVKLYTCAKFGFDVTNKLTEFAEKCTSYLKKEEYQEKCLKGELTSDSVTCPYCQTKYDRVKQANCPHCGAYPRGK